MKKGFITFDSSAKNFILGVFGTATDSEGFIIDKITKEKVLSPNLEPLKKDDFGGLRKGSLVFIKNDLPSIVELSDALSK